MCGQTDVYSPVIFDNVIFLLYVWPQSKRYLHDLNCSHVLKTTWKKKRCKKMWYIEKKDFDYEDYDTVK